MKTRHSLLAFATVLLMSVFGAAPSVGPLRPISAPGTTNFAGAGNSHSPAFSADGRHVVFLSQANNLVTKDDLAPYLDVFVREGCDC